MPLLNTYTNLTDVKRILRSNAPQGRIRFSEHYNFLKKSNDNTGTIELTKVGISQDYSDVANYNIVFGSDSTSFTVYKVDSDKVTNFIVGQGIKQKDFTTNDGFFAIDATAWSGWSFPGDLIDFQTDSHISTNDGTRFIQDAELFVDAILETNIRFTTTSELSLRFDSTSVPKAIQLAATKLSAYFIYKSIYFETNVAVGDKVIDASQVWLKEGMDLIGNYVSKNNLALATSAPVLGHFGTNKPVDLNNDFIFRSSEFNLRIPVQALFWPNSYFFNDIKAFNFLGASNYQDSLVSDLQDLSYGGFGY